MSFGGIKVGQSWADLVFWELLLNSHTPNAVFELGTWEGGFAWWMWAQSRTRGFSFYTFDATVPEHRMPPYAFSRANVFLENEKISGLLRMWEPLILFCDNGNKPREVQMYAPVLQHSDSLIVVHDWGNEIHPEDIPDSLEMLYGDKCEALGTLLRVFRKRDG